MIWNSLRRPPTRAAHPALTLIAALFFVAGLSRLGMGVAAVIAAETEAAVPQSEAASVGATDALLAALTAREATIDAEEADLAQKKAALAAAEADIRSQLATLAEAEARLLQTLSLTESAAEDDVTRLVAIYENMKPAQAAELFGQMDVDFAAGFFVRLRPDFAGAVMAELDPVSAYAISAVLAGRHARTPRN